MGGLSIWHWVIVLLVVLVLFGRGRISEIMGDFGKGIKSFKEGVNEESDKRSASPPPHQIPTAQIPPAQTPVSSDATSTKTNETTGTPT